LIGNENTDFVDSSDSKIYLREFAFPPEPEDLRKFALHNEDDKRNK